MKNFLNRFLTAIILLLTVSITSCTQESQTDSKSGTNFHEAPSQPPIFGFDVSDPKIIFLIDKEETTEAELSAWTYCEGSGYVHDGIWFTRFYNEKGEYLEVARSLRNTFVESDFNNVGSSPGPFGSTIYWMTNWVTSC